MKQIIITIALIISALIGRADPVNIGVDGCNLIVFSAPDSLATGKGVIILPGGGYTHLAMNHEGLDWAEWFNSRGVTAAVFAYPMPQGEPARTSSAVLNAIRLLKSRAAEWNFDPAHLGIMGSSAGGHLASTIATQAPDSLRPAFQILFYPVISMDSTISHPGSRKNLLGKAPSPEMVSSFSSECRVDSLTPPVFIALSNDDGAVPPANSLRYHDALTRAGQSVALHIYPVGGHGWGFRKSFKYHDAVTANLAQWLENF